MFKTLRVNSPIYILTRAYTPTLETAIISQPVPPPRRSQYNNGSQNPYQQYQQDWVVDIVAQCNGERRNIQGLPADMVAAECGNTYVTEDKNLIINEIRNLFQQEEAKVNGYEHSKELLDVYSTMLNTLVPEEMERKRNAEKIGMLENSLAQQSKLNEEILKQLQAMSAQNKELANMLEATKNESKNKSKQ